MALLNSVVITFITKSRHHHQRHVARTASCLHRFPMPGDITHRDIARAAKLHQTTVSRALANHPGISSVTRLRVQKTAKRLGYIPDPALSALTARRWTVRRIAYRATLAWIVKGRTPDWWKAVQIF